MRLDKIWILFWLTIAITLRFMYLDWGFPYTFHIDEETIIIATQKLCATFKAEGRLINPSTSWGNVVFVTLGLLRYPFLFLKKAFATERLFLIFLGRMIAASLSFLGLGVIFLLAKRLYNRRVALLSLAFNAVLVIMIRAAHFYTLEVFVFFFLGLTLLFGAKIMRRGYSRDYFWAFFCFGLAISSKVTTLLAVLPLIYAHYHHIRVKQGKLLNKNLLFAPITLVVYFILNPTVLQNLQTGAVSGTTDLFWVMKQMFGSVKPSWTLHFEGLPLFWYEVSHQFSFGMGYFLEIAMLAGVAFCLYRRREQDVYLLLWVIPFYLLIGSWRTKYIRYIVPLVPFGLIAGAAFCDWLYSGLSEKKLRYACLIVLGGGLLSSSVYALAFTNIYGAEDSRILAYQWARENIQAGATLLLERDESLRIPFAKEGVKVIWSDREQLYYYLKREAKIPYLAERLAEADYLIVGETNRLRYLHTPKLNPVEYLYYTGLDDGFLGFEKVKDYKVNPHIGPLVFDDEQAEQSFHLFDHPRVMVFKKTRQLPVKKILLERLLVSSLL